MIFDFKTEFFLGLYLVEFKEAVDLQHHMVSKRFDFKQFSSTTDIPLSQKQFLRSPRCPLLINGDKCQECLKKEVKLRAEFKQKRKNLQSPVLPNAPLSLVSPDRLVSTVQSQRAENKSLRLENVSLKKRLNEALSKNTVAVDATLNDDLVSIFKGAPEQKIPPFMKLFWEEQQKYLHTKDKTQLRYHPAIIKFCLSIAAKSSAAYEQLRLNANDGSGVLILPSQRTLRSYRNYIKPKQGM